MVIQTELGTLRRTHYSVQLHEATGIYKITRDAKAGHALMMYEKNSDSGNNSMGSYAKQLCVFSENRLSHKPKL